MELLLGVTLSHEGGAHQSIITPNIGMAQPNLDYYEPSYADELSFLFFWALNNIQAKNGKSVYFRFSTKKLRQPERIISNSLKNDLIKGGYWFNGPIKNVDLLFICTGVIVGEVLNAIDAMKDDNLQIGLFVVSSPDKLYQDWMQSTKKVDLYFLLKNSFLK